MAQFARPASDKSNDNWTDEGSSFNDGNLYTSIREVTQDGDTSYVNGEGDTPSGLFEVTLSAVTDPEVSTGHYLRFWMYGQGSGAAERIDVRLRQTSTPDFTVAQFANLNRDSPYGDVGRVLTAIEADLITDYSALYVEVDNDNIGSGEFVRITQIYLEVPDAPVGDVSVSESESATVSDTDSVGPIVLPATPSESSGVTDSPTAYVSDPQIVESETISSVTDTPAADIPLEVAESESVTAADSDTVDPILLELSASESATAADQTPILAGLAPADIDILESESVTVADSPGRNLVPLVGESESASVADTPQYYSELVTTLDRVTVSVVGGAPADRSISESESVTVNDTPSLAISTLEVAESESVTVADTDKAVVVPLVAESESVSVADAPALALSTLLVAESESATVGDAPTGQVATPGIPSILESEGVTVADTPTLILSTLEVAESESVSVADTDKVVVVLLIAESESVSVADSPTALVSNPQISESEAVSVTDAASLLQRHQVVESEAVSVSDQPAIALSVLAIAVSESPSVADSPTVSSGAILALSVSESESAGVTDALVARPVVALTTTESASVADSPTVGAFVLLFAVVDTVTVADNAIMAEYATPAYRTTVVAAVARVYRPVRSNRTIIIPERKRSVKVN